MDSEAIEKAAARWFARRQGGTWSDVDQAQFDAWLSASTAHRIQYIRVTAAWEHFGRLKALGAGVPTGVIPPRGEWGDARFARGASADAERLQNASEEPISVNAASKPARATIQLRFVALAASVLLMLAGAVYLYSSGLFADQGYATPVGSIETIALEDGSHVTLNTDSRIRVELRDRERHIALSRGEAFFEVAHDSTRPFVVEAGDRRIVAVGTKFSVRRQGEELQVIVTEGKVRVEAGSAVEPGSDVLLVAGSIARTMRNEVFVRPNVAPEAEHLLSWRQGYVSFDNVTLAEAVAEFNRHNTRKIYVEDPEIAGIRVGGNFRSNNAEAFLWLLQSGFAIRVEEDDDRIVLKPR